MDELLTAADKEAVIARVQGMAEAITGVWKNAPPVEDDDENTYLVGGAVRDTLLGREIHDRDWCVVGKTPEQMMKEGFVPVGKDFPVFLHPETKEEYALARTERKSGHGYHGFEVCADPTVTIEQDLARRDITINAIALPEGALTSDGEWDGDKGALVDPYGGVRDIENGVLRHVGSAFAEDPVRVLRVARFAAQLPDFSVAPETVDLCQRIVESGECAHLTPERIWAETAKALMSPAPAKYFRVLDEMGALEAIFPQVAALKDVPQLEEWHPEKDALEHSLLSLQVAADMEAPLRVRFAALVHDLGKAVTPKDMWPSHHDHEKLGVPIVKQMCESLRVPADVKRFALMATLNHDKAHRIFKMSAPGALRLLEATNAFSHQSKDDWQDLLKVCECDSRGRTGWEDRPYMEAVAWKHVASQASQVKEADIAKAVIERHGNGRHDLIKQEIHVARLNAVKGAMNAVKAFDECLQQTADSEKRVVLASANPGKLMELAPLLAGSGHQLVSVSHYHLPDTPEPYDTLEENALHKALIISEQTGCPAISDDSGVYVEGLNGAPGAFAARHEHNGLRAHEAVRAQLNEMFSDEDDPSRYASMKNVLAFADAKTGEEIVAKGEITGRIIPEPRGDNGFGYDNIFELSDGRTIAELSSEEKSCVSARAQAAQELLACLEDEIPVYRQDNDGLAATP
ncbi:MAG: multifunctional CCA addition/repair protein [Actinomycetaceae bacterium]|nr:multifunctional CCA addition/repair protein [Actinomycetaceae bacterium]